MIDRFSDSTQENDPPPVARIYDRGNKVYITAETSAHNLALRERPCVTALWLHPWYDNYDRLTRSEKEERQIKSFRLNAQIFTRSKPSAHWRTAGAGDERTAWGSR